MVATIMPTGITATGMEAFGMVDTGTRGIGILAPLSSWRRTDGEEGCGAACAKVLATLG